uniref:Uncharacterized protein n=1 Tax=Ganoderma boninense TaxID=34458 RepID=A0A5K1JXV5_9APHY|nr:Uncharacterized protein [Ganoderma boninense]
MLDYLNSESAGFHRTFVLFKEESSQVIDLESRLSQALQDNAIILNPASINERSNSDWLSTVTCPTLGLTGRKANANAVTFHPRYAILVSASDNNTMKV